MSATGAGYDSLLEAVESGDGYYLRCPNGHGSLPPRRVCPDCGDSQLSETPLDDVGTLRTYTVIHVAAPSTDLETPYTTAIASFGDVRVTGVLTGVDPEEASTGMDVRLGCTGDEENRVMTLSPA